MHFINKQKDGLDLNPSMFALMPVLLSCWEGLFHRSYQLTGSFNSSSWLLPPAPALTGVLETLSLSVPGLSSSASVLDWAG